MLPAINLYIIFEYLAKLYEPRMSLWGLIDLVHTESTIILQDPIND